MCKKSPVSSVLVLTVILTSCGVAPEEMDDLPSEEAEERSPDLVKEFSLSTIGPPPPPGTTQIKAFDCFVSNGDSCSRVTWCDSGVILGIQVACNLEKGFVSDGLVSALPMNRMYVERPSDVVSDGRCTVENYSIAQYGISMSPIRGRRIIRYGCSERDATSRGDCHLVGLLYCGN
jgi:hypothetical protein